MALQRVALLCRGWRCSSQLHQQQQRLNSSSSNRESQEDSVLLPKLVNVELPPVTSGSCRPAASDTAVLQPPTLCSNQGVVGQGQRSHPSCWVRGADGHCQPLPTYTSGPWLLASSTATPSRMHVGRHSSLHCNLASALHPAACQPGVNGFANLAAVEPVSSRSLPLHRLAPLKTASRRFQSPRPVTSKSAAAALLLQDIEEACQSGDEHQARRLLHSPAVSKAPRRVRVHMYEALLKLHGRRGQPRAALALLKEMRSSGVAVGYIAHGCLVTAFALAGDLQGAEDYLAKQPPRMQTSRMYATLLRAALQQGDPAAADRLLARHDGSGQRRDAVVWEQILRLEALRGSADGVQAQWNALQRAGVPVSAELHAARVTALARSAPLIAALVAFEEFAGLAAAGSFSSLDKRRRSGSVKHCLLRACHIIVTAANEAGRAELAQMALTSLSKAGCKRDVALHNSALRLALAQGRPAAAVEDLVEAMLAAHIAPDARTLTLLARAYVAAGEPDRALALLHQAHATHTQVEAPAYNAVLERYAAEGRLAEAGEVYEQMRRAAVPPDVVTYHALFRAVVTCCQALLAQRRLRPQQQEDQAACRSDTEQLQAAGRQLQGWSHEFEAAGLRHSTASLTSLVQALGHTHQIDAMLHLLLSLTGSAAQPSVNPFNAAIAACARLGRQDDALQVQSVMHAQGLAPDAHTFTALISGCAYIKDLDQANSLLHAMEESGLKPTVVTYNALLKTQVNCGEFDTALTLLGHMRNVGPAPDGSTWPGLLGAAKQQGRPDFAEEVLTHIPEGERQHYEHWQQWVDDLANRRPLYNESDDDDWGWL